MSVEAVIIVLTMVVLIGAIAAGAWLFKTHHGRDM